MTSYLDKLNVMFKRYYCVLIYTLNMAHQEAIKFISGSVFNFYLFQLPAIQNYKRKEPPKTP